MPFFSEPTENTGTTSTSESVPAAGGGKAGLETDPQSDASSTGSSFGKGEKAGGVQEKKGDDRSVLNPEP